MKRLEIKALDTNTAVILLKGIFGVDIICGDVAEQIREARKNYSTIWLDIHSKGGDPVDGSVLIQEINVTKSTHALHTKNIGIAASYGSVIFAMGQEREMGRYSRLMTHQASMSITGQVDDISENLDNMRGYNDEMAQIYADASGKDVEWVKENWMKRGANKWFRADEAKAAGLATKIVDGLLEYGADADIPTITALFDDAINKKYQIKPKYNMNLSMYIPTLNKVNGSSLSAEASEAEIQAGITTALNQAATMSAELATKNAEINTLKGSVLVEKAEALVTAQVGVKITAEEVEFYKSMAQISDDAFAKTKAQFDKMPVIQDAAAFIAQGAKDALSAKTDDGKAVLDLPLKEIHKNHPKVYAALRKNDPETFKAKYVAQYGSEPKM